MQRLFLLAAALVFCTASASAQSVDCSRMSSIATADTGEYHSCLPSGLVSDKPIDPALVDQLFGKTTKPAFGINLRAGSATTRGFIGFNATTPATTTPVLATVDNFYAGDYAGDDFTKVYATLVPAAPAISDLYSINPTTGARTLIGTTALPAGSNPLDMTWDYTTSTMYLTASGGTPAATSLYTLNLTTGAATLVAQVTGGTLVTGINLFAHPFTGVLYAVDLASDALHSINKTTGVATSIGPVGVNLGFAQGADFDAATGTAYMCAYVGAGVNSLRTVDLATGASTSVGSFDNAEVDICAIATALGAPPSGPILTGPATVDFGSTTAVGATSSPRTVTLSNGGTAATTVTSITGSGAPFTVNAPALPLTIAPGGSATFTVTFSPTTTAPATGTVTVVSNAPNSPLVINLTGSGFVPPTNDNVANATALTAATGTFTGSSANATVEAGEPVPSCQATQGASVWWRYTPAQNGRLTVDLSQSSFDTVLTFHQPGTTQIGCDDDGATTPNSLASILTDIPVVAGSPVLIRIAGFGATPATGTVSGTYTFTGTTAGEGSAATGQTTLTASPNPVRSAARVSFTTATATDVTVAVYDVTGRQIATLFQGAVAADQTVAASLNAAGLSPGVYVVRATGAGVSLTQRVTVVR